jgi:hypothetical protein
MSTAAISYDFFISFTHTGTGAETAKRQQQQER